MVEELSAHRASVRALLARFPRLAADLRHTDLQVAETPVERWTVDGATLLVKRDDLSAPALGGNKVRPLELLLAGLGVEHTLLTVGPAGSTHALAVAEYGVRIGAASEVITWPQPMHDVARATRTRMESLAMVTSAGSVPEAYLRAGARRFRRNVVWIPAGGSSPLGAVAHISAALELIEQLARDDRPVPDAIVVEIVQLFVTLGMVAVATCDMLGGFRYIVQIEGSVRDTLQV